MGRDLLRRAVGRTPVLEPAERDYMRAAYFFQTFAPAVLACDGDTEAEVRALARPGVYEAYTAYLEVLAKIQRRGERKRREAVEGIVMLSEQIGARCAVGV